MSPFGASCAGRALGNNRDTPLARTQHISPDLVDADTTQLS